MCLSWSPPASCAGPLLRARGRNRNRRACPGQFSTRNGGELRACFHGELSAARRMVCQAPSALARPVRLRRSHGDVSGIRIVSRETTSRLPSLPWLQGAESRPNPLEHPRGRAGCGLPPPPRKAAAKARGESATQPRHKPAAKIPRHPATKPRRRCLAKAPPRTPYATSARNPAAKAPRNPATQASRNPVTHALRKPATKARHESPPRKPATHASGNPATHALHNPATKADRGSPAPSPGIKVRH